MVVLTPDGRLLHAVTGYIKAKELHFELTQALASWEKVKEAALTAELSIQRRALVVRQDEVQKAWSNAFGPKPAKKGAVQRGTHWVTRQAKHDREIIREHALLHAGNITTRMLTGGPGTHFGYSNGESEGDSTPAINERRRNLGIPPVRETAGQKRVRERREAASRARPGAQAPARAAGGGVTARR